MQTALSVPRAIETTSRPGFSVRRWLGRFGRVFSRSELNEAITTGVRFEASPDEVWEGLHFYEDLPQRPMLFLRLFLPRPVRTEGKKTEVGSIIVCKYDGGHIVKRITLADAPRELRFEVLEQALGVEDCISMGEGSYQIRSVAGGCEVLLTTMYRGHLRPRWLWRPLERFLCRRVHRHILEGMRAALTRGGQS